MKLSIVIPAYNEEAYLGKCLAAIKTELEKSHAESEVIVVNNASQDRTAEVARQFSFVHLIDEPCKGLVRARQAGYLACHGDLIANIDADTLMPAGWIAEVLREFTTNPKLVALSGPYIYYDLPLLHNWFVHLFYRIGQLISLLRTLLTGKSGTMLQGGNFVLRKDALDRAGGFDLSFDFYGEDTAIAKRMSIEGTVKFSFCLPMYTSGRRLQTEGLFKMAHTYALNFIWPLFFGRAYTKRYKDIRL